MARTIRVEYPGAAYHVTARGNERKAIFRDDTDRGRFLETVREAVERFGLAVHAFCLMPNHYHLVLAVARGFSKPEQERNEEDAAAHSQVGINERDGEYRQYSQDE